MIKKIATYSKLWFVLPYLPLSKRYNKSTNQLTWITLPAFLFVFLNPAVYQTPSSPHPTPSHHIAGTTARVYTRSKSVFTYSDGTYEEEYSCWPPAVCMILISLVEIVLFCYDAAHGSTQAQGPIAQIFIYNPHRREEAWRFLTYMLVHVG